jgi:hypothetical protein
MFAMQMFDILSFIVPIMFIVVFGIIIFSIIQGISTWHKNNNSPRLTVPAVIVAKRTDVLHYQHANAGDMSGAHVEHDLLCHVSGGKRGPDGVPCFRLGIWYACRG